MADASTTEPAPVGRRYLLSDDRSVFLGEHPDQPGTFCLCLWDGVTTPTQMKIPAEAMEAIVYLAQTSRPGLGTPFPGAAIEQVWSSPPALSIPHADSSEPSRVARWRVNVRGILRGTSTPDETGLGLTDESLWEIYDYAAVGNEVCLRCDTSVIVMAANAKDAVAAAKDAAPPLDITGGTRDSVEIWVDPAIDVSPEPEPVNRSLS